MRQSVAHYRIRGPLGEGGMGVVLAAEDERLGRSVALKMIRGGQADGEARQRFWREARVAASISHPNVCQVYEIGETDGELFIAMELLEGESLAARLLRGPLGAAETAGIAAELLAGLQAIHHAGHVHRDLKPSNVYLTPHGAKLLDFGLARARRPADGEALERTATEITNPGTVLGTWHYMSPEQARGEPADARSDLFAVGAILFEMLTGGRAFAGDTAVLVLHAVLYEQPPALTGSPAILAVDRVLRRALAKRPGDRFASAEAMAEALRRARLPDDSGATRARALTRLIALPFRVLRPDPETDFLAFSLPDAVSTTLAGLESLVVRSSVVAARYAGAVPDLKAIAADADVDVVLAGTVLRGGDQLRVTAQLVDAPAGTVLCSHTSQLPLRDLFQVQDELVQRIVQSLSLPLTARELRMLRQDVPQSASAYEFYLRANEVARDPHQVTVARDLYRQCLEHDPRYAPAWARLARCFRFIGKYSSGTEALDRAEEALQRALELNPELPLAHHLGAQVECDRGRAVAAMERLLARAAAGADPELFAGLVHACRYGGLLEASVAAHAEARRLDPNIQTGVAHSYAQLGELGRALEASGEDPSVRPFCLLMVGREEEAGGLLRAAHDRMKRRGDALDVWRLWVRAFLALLDGRTDELTSAVDQLEVSVGQDPEALFYGGLILVRAGAEERGLEVLGKAVDQGFGCAAQLARLPWLGRLQASPGFAALRQRAETRRAQAAAAFVAAGGERLLGVAVS